MKKPKSETEELRKIDALLLGMIADAKKRAKAQPSRKKPKRADDFERDEAPARKKR